MPERANVLAGVPDAAVDGRCASAGVTVRKSTPGSPPGEWRAETDGDVTASDGAALPATAARCSCSAGWPPGTAAAASRKPIVATAPSRRMPVSLPGPSRDVHGRPISGRLPRGLAGCNRMAASHARLPCMRGEPGTEAPETSDPESPNALGRLRRVPTMRDIATAAGVSQSTVSRSSTMSPPRRSLTRNAKRVQDAARELGIDRTRSRAPSLPDHAPRCRVRDINDRSSGRDEALSSEARSEAKLGPRPRARTRHGASHDTVLEPAMRRMSCMGAHAGTTRPQNLRDSNVRSSLSGKDDPLDVRRSMSTTAAGIRPASRTCRSL